MPLKNLGKLIFWMKRSLGLHHDFPFGRLRACSRAWPSHLGEQEGLQLDPVTSKELSIKFDDFQPDKEELSHQAMYLGEGGGAEDTYQYNMWRLTK